MHKSSSATGSMNTTMTGGTHRWDTLPQSTTLKPAPTQYDKLTHRPPGPKRGGGPASFYLGLELSAGRNQDRRHYLAEPKRLQFLPITDQRLPMPGSCGSPVVLGTGWSISRPHEKFQL